MNSDDKAPMVFLAVLCATIVALCLIMLAIRYYKGQNELSLECIRAGNYVIDGNCVKP